MAISYHIMITSSLKQVFLNSCIFLLEFKMFIIVTIMKKDGNGRKY